MWVWDGRKDGEGYPAWKTRVCGLIPFVFGVVRTKGQFRPQALKAGKVGSGPALILSLWVTLGKLVNFSEPRFPYLYNGMIIIASPRES